MASKILDIRVSRLFVVFKMSFSRVTFRTLIAFKFLQTLVPLHVIIVTCTIKVTFAAFITFVLRFILFLN